MRCMMAVMLLLAGASLNPSRAQGQARGQNPNPTQSTVLNRTDDLLRQQFLNDPTKFILRGSNPPPMPGGPVSVAELKIPEKAMKEFLRSDKALRAGDMRGSAEHMEKGLAIYPNLPAGHSALGTRYVALKEYDKAVEEYEKTLALKPSDRAAVDGIAAVLCLQHRWAEAEPVERRALQMEPEASTSQYLLGSTLVEEGNYSDEATRLLEKVKTTYGRARLFLAMAEEGRGENRQAAEELREYLRLGWPEYQQLAKDWLARLEAEKAKDTK